MDDQRIEEIARWHALAQCLGPESPLPTPAERTGAFVRAIREALSSQEEERTAGVMVEPEVVWHYDCPVVLAAALREEAGRPSGVVSYTHPVMRLAKRLDDVAGRKRVYECPECGALTDVNFPPVSEIAEELRSLREERDRLKSNLAMEIQTSARLANERACEEVDKNIAPVEQKVT